MNNTINNELEIRDLDFSTINKACESLSEWQKMPGFNDFLKEGAMCPGRNMEFIAMKLGGVKTVAKIGMVKEQVAGIIWLHGFNEEDSSLEGSFRANPKMSGRGIVTMLTRVAVAEALKKEGIRKVDFWHSAFNLGSFNVCKNAGGRIADFVESQTFLPNIGVVTDDFKWEIRKVEDGKNNFLLPIINPMKLKTISDGLIKHGIKDKALEASRRRFNEDIGSISPAIAEELLASTGGEKNFL